ncbi:MAG: hypothetical protein M1835_004232 [Candelina submexicana]|nr:MAG: hypothetical protein M1835_004232 [Candelina submexicana]
MSSTTAQTNISPKIYVVEHLDPELGPWSALEYRSIAEETNATGSRFCLTSVSPSLQVPQELRGLRGLEIKVESVEQLFATEKEKVCLLDPTASKELNPNDGDNFDIFLFGGILGDDPPRDRTSELRRKGFEGRRLGPKQMTTDTAVRVTRTVVQDKAVALADIPYIDHPELQIDEHESSEMPFRYMTDRNNQPITPEVSRSFRPPNTDGCIVT